MTQQDGESKASTAKDIPVTQRAGPARLLYIDNLRIALTALVVLHHTAVTYSTINAWFYTEPAKDGSGMLLDIFVMVNQAFFMGFFFLIAGLFTPGSYERKGAGPFLRDRLKRLGIPLLAFLLLIRPIVDFGAYERFRDRLSYWAFYIDSWDPGPMWFVEVLLVFTAAYVLLRRRRERRARAVPADAQARGVCPLRPRSLVAFGLGLTLATYLWRILVPVGTYVPVLGLPSPNYLPQYASFFALGVLAHRRGWLTSLSRTAGRIGFAVSAVATLAFLPVALLSPPESIAGFGTWESLAMAAWESALALGMVLGLTVLFRERLNHQGRTATFLSRHAFTVYLVHPPVLVALGYAFRWLHAPAIEKFALVATLALPLCWTLAYAVRSLPHADRVL